MFGQKRLSREGGVEIVVKELCTRMAQKGCDVTCYNRAGHHVSGAEYDDAGKTEYEGIRQKSVPTIERRGLAAVSSSFSQHFVVHLEDTMWCISMQKDRRSLHGCRRCLGKELLLPSMALIGSARNGNQDLALSLSTKAKKCCEICGRGHCSEQRSAEVFLGDLRKGDTFYPLMVSIGQRFGKQS